MEIIYHYPPELLNLLVDTIPLLCRSKKDVLLFLRGAGTPDRHLRDLQAQVEAREPINKYEIVRTVLARLNEAGEVSLRERREILRRVVEFEDFTRCWPDDQLKAKGLVAEISRVVNVKDSFTRMRKERDDERRAHIRQFEERVKSQNERNERLEQLQGELAALFTVTDPQQRGLRLEATLNRIFEVEGLLIRESFRRVDNTEDGVLEQIDGVIELDGEIYLVEVKWLSKAVSVGDVSHHLVRVFGRGSGRGLFISVTEFSPAALTACRDALRDKVVVLALLQELVELLEGSGDLAEFLRSKIRRAVIDKEPYARPR